MAWDVETLPLAPHEYADWERLVAEAPGGSIYSLPSYLDALCTAGGGRYRILAVRRNAEIVGGVALYERDSAGGTFVSPRLLLFYNGVVVRRYETQYPSENTARHIKILASLETAISALGLASIKLHSRALHDVRAFTAAGWSATPAYSYVVQLDIEQAWARVEQNLRRLVERARGEGMVFSDDDDFDSFYRLHESTLKRHDTGVYLPRNVFKQYFETLYRQSLARIFHVRVADGRAVSSQLVLLGPHGVSHTVSAGADPDFNKRGATAMLRWHGFEQLAKLGFRGNDLTGAALDPVTHFKSQLGGTLEMSMTLRSRETRKFRVVTAAVAARWKSRSLAGTVARRVLRRAPESA